MEEIAMRVGVVFPQTEIGTDPHFIRDYAQTTEELGYSHILASDHVIGANLSSRPGWKPPYSHLDQFHEPFVLFGYLAGLTRKIELVTGIIILPQRQTVLVAKQAAALDVLSGGRLRLGIGIGWNPVEYEALGENFHNRGRRCEEQIAVLRALWTQEVVHFKGQWHQISHAGLNPLPVQRPIPIWIGAGRSVQPIPPEAALRRIGRLADGWFPMFSPSDAGQEAITRMRAYAREAGRDPAAIGIEGRVSLASQEPQDWLAQMQAWETLGATHLSLRTDRGVQHSPQAHIDALRRF